MYIRLWVEPPYASHEMKSVAALTEAGVSYKLVSKDELSEAKKMTDELG